MKRILGFLSLAFVMTQFSSGSAHASCSSDQALQEAHFKVHSSTNFSNLSNSVLNLFLSSRDNFVYDTKGPMRANHKQNGQQMLTMISFDDVTTPKSSRYGDVVFMYANEPAKNQGMGKVSKISTDPLASLSDLTQLVEVRWWDKGARQVVYNKDWTDCAVNTIPIADNALF